MLGKDIVDVELNLFYEESQTLLKYFVKSGHNVKCYYKEEEIRNEEEESWWDMVSIQESIEDCVSEDTIQAINVELERTLSEWRPIQEYEIPSDISCVSKHVEKAWHKEGLKKRLV